MGTIISTRKHPFYTKRMPQLDLNRLANAGGRDYIDARLWRAPNETDAQWFGDKEEGIVGRKERSCLVNDAQRIVSKIRQYIFKKAPERKGADEEWTAQAGGEGVSVNDFMGRVCDALTTGQWCWIQVDTTSPKYDQFGNPLPQTLENKPTVFWRLWESCSVPDWCIEADGTLRWIVVRTLVFNNTDPMQEPLLCRLSTLFYLNPADGKVYKTEEADKPVPFPLATHEEVKGLDSIPFILVGNPSSEGWWFDDVENIQAQVMNYDSMHNETLTDAVYPQLVVPMGLLNTLETNVSLDKVGAKQLIILQRELIKGRKNPFYEQAEEKGVTRYIQPASGDLELVTKEQERKRKLLFDMCGLALFNRESRQVQTAESKSFDQLDTNATLGNRALLLQRAERLAVMLSEYFDPSFKKYDPVYNTKFDVVDVEKLADAITQMSQLPHITPKMRRLCLKAAMRILLETGGVDEDTYNGIMAEIDAIPDDKLQPQVTLPFDDDDGTGDNDATGEGGDDDLSDKTDDELREMAESDDTEEARRAKAEIRRRGEGQKTPLTRDAAV